jgi:hypothetical protein
MSDKIIQTLSLHLKAAFQIWNSTYYKENFNSKIQCCFLLVEDCHLWDMTSSTVDVSEQPAVVSTIIHTDNEASNSVTLWEIPKQMLHY